MGLAYGVVNDDGRGSQLFVNDLLARTDVGLDWERAHVHRGDLGAELLGSFLVLEKVHRHVRAASGQREGNHTAQFSGGAGNERHAI